MIDPNNDSKRFLAYITSFEMSSSMFDRLVATLLSMVLCQTLKSSLKTIVIPIHGNNKKLLNSGSAVNYLDWMTDKIERRAMKSGLAFTLRGMSHKNTFS